MVEKKIILIFYMDRFSVFLFSHAIRVGELNEEFRFFAPFFVLILKITHSFEIFHDWVLLGSLAQ